MIHVDRLFSYHMSTFEWVLTKNKYWTVESFIVSRVSYWQLNFNSSALSWTRLGIRQRYEAPLWNKSVSQNVWRNLTYSTCQWCRNWSCWGRNAECRQVRSFYIKKNFANFKHSTVLFHPGKHSLYLPAVLSFCMDMGQQVAFFHPQFYLLYVAIWWI